MVYILLTKSIRENGLILIGEKSKKDIMEMMNWYEQKFRENTLKIE